MDTIWEKIFLHEKSPLKLSPLECLLYGAGTEEAPKLLKDFPYRISMNGYVKRSNRMYYAYFCLYETPEGKTEIHHAKWNDKTHGRNWGMCKIEN